jgi:hypothetical protein
MVGQQGGVMKLNEWLDEQFGKIMPENEYQLLKIQGACTHGIPRR